MAPPRSRGWGSPDWEEFPPAKPIPVQGGLTARSTRGGIGEQWWSRRFIEVLESFALGGRLTRGRNYARKGQVISLAVEPGEVTATVQGSRPRPYNVKIGLPRFTELIWAKAEVVLAEQAIHSARLLAGDFPPELEPVFAGIGAPLFPARLSDLELSCSCPDHVIPCKHLAAVFYLLAERFDDDPFLILRWRGRSREALLGRLRELRGDETTAPDPAGTTFAEWQAELDGDDDGTVAGPEPAPALSARQALPADPPSRSHEARRAGSASDSPESTVNFWTAGQTPPLPVQPVLPVDLLLRLLPVPGAALGGNRLLTQLGPLYQQLAEPTPETYGGSRHGNLYP